MVLTTTDVLEAISEQESLKLFRIVATSTTNLYVTDILISKTKLSRKQFYSRMSKLTKAGLIKRIQGKYTLTAFGKVVYYTQIKIENAVNNYWKLKALDSIVALDHLPTEERIKFIYDLIKDQEIKDILVTDKDNKDNDNNNKLESDQHFIDIELQKQKHSINQN
jgi:DNA-binding Lrp family transcriptional regulator